MRGREKRTWLIIGHYGGKNTGDEAMLKGLLYEAKHILGKVVIVTKDASVPVEPPPGVEVYAVRPTIRLILSNLRRAHAVILGGGTHFQDDYKGLRYLRHLRYMFRIIGVSFVAKLIGKKVYWLGMGFGPFYRRLTRWVTKLGVWCCDGITVRDKASEKELLAIVGRHRNYLLTFDLAALLVEIKDPNLVKRQDNLIGISITSIQKALTGGVSVERKFLECLQSSIVKLLKEKPLRLRVFVFRGGDRESDEKLSYEFYQNLLSEGVAVELFPYDNNPLNTFEKVAECKYFIATRYHSAVFGYLAGCKLLFLAYHRKVADLADEIGLSRDAVIEIGAGVSEDSLYLSLKRLTTDSKLHEAKLPVNKAVQLAKLNFSILG